MTDIKTLLPHSRSGNLILIVVNFVHFLSNVLKNGWALKKMFYIAKKGKLWLGGSQVPPPPLYEFLIK